MKNPQEQPEDPKPKSKTPKKKDIKKSKINNAKNSKEIILTNAEDIEMLKSLVENQLDSEELEQYNSKADIQKDMLSLNSVIQEYLSSFVVMGYTLDGTRITIKNTQNDRDEDALIEQLRFIFLRTMGGEE